MDKDNITPDGQPEAAPIVDAAADPKGTVSNEVADSISLKEINEFLGKNYKDKEGALKSLKDTFSFVGKKVEAPKPVEGKETKPDATAEFAKQLRELKDQLFYSENPDYKPYKSVISKMGDNPSDVVQTDEFKTIFDKASGFDKIQKQKTVLETNPRIGTVRNKLQEAQDSASKRDYNSAGKLATEAVLEAYGL